MAIMIFGPVSNSSNHPLDFPLKCLKYDVSLKILVFCKNNKWSIENHGLVTQKYGLRFQLGKPPKYLTTFSAHLPIWPIILDIFEKILVTCLMYLTI